MTVQKSIPFICVYHNPSDYPDKFVARLWYEGQPTQLAMVADSLKDIRSAMPAEMVIMRRRKNDDPVIVETWWPKEHVEAQVLSSIDQFFKGNRIRKRGGSSRG